MRESPALKILRLLRDRGGDVAYHDPHVPELPDLGLRSAELPAAAEGADLAVIVTAHPTVDHRAITEQAHLTLDLRGVTRGLGAAAVQL
jgi:UDP-N-acetyl-D-glucosamine dehydrogenase